MTRINNNPWRGYNLTELRYARARAAAQSAASRITLTSQWHTLRTGNPITRSWKSMRDILSAVGYVNSAIMAWQLVRSLRGVFRTAMRK